MMERRQAEHGREDRRRRRDPPLHLHVLRLVRRRGPGVPGFERLLGGGGSAWDALDVIPIFLMAAIVVALGRRRDRGSPTPTRAAVSLNTRRRGARRPRGPADPLPDHQPARRRRAFGGVSVDITLEFWIFLGLIAAAGIAYGGYSAMQEEGTTFGGAADRLSGPGGGGPDRSSSAPGASSRLRPARPQAAAAPAGPAAAAPAPAIPPPPPAQQPPPPPRRAARESGRRGRVRRSRRRPAWRRR